MLRRARAERAAHPRRSRSPGRGIPSQALQAALIALCVMLGQGTSLLHLLIVPHATCEHGELVELESRSAPPRAAPLEDGAKQAGIQATAPGDGEHEHCDERARLHSMAAIGPAVGEASLLCIEPRSTLGERGETRPVALLSLAPKSSPPAA